MLTLKKVEQSFRRSLRTYDQHAFVQLEIAETLAKILIDITLEEQKFESVFEFGCGTGFLTKALLKQFKVKYYELNDLVPECEFSLSGFLNELPRSQLASWDFIPGDINHHRIEKSYNLICSTSTLQWVADIPKLVAKIQQSLSTNGLFAFSSFGPHHFQELKQLNQILDNQITSLNYLTETQWKGILADGFEVRKLSSNTITLWFDSFQELLMHLRKTGVNGNSRMQWSQAKLKIFAEQYQDKFMKNGKIPLSYEPVYGVAKSLR